MDKFEFWCQKVIPLAYDNALSYYEVLCKTRDYINNLIEEDAQMLERIKVLEEKFVLSEEDIQNMIDASITAFLTATVEPLVTASKNEAINTSKNYTDEVVRVTKEEVIAVCNNYALALYQQMKDYVDAKFVEYSYMISPFSGKKEDVRDVVTEIVYKFHKTNALTASEYDALELTASAYDGYLLTAFDYDFNAKTLLV